MSRFAYRVSIMTILPIGLNAFTPETGAASGASNLVAGNTQDAWLAGNGSKGLAQYGLILSRLLKWNGLK